MKRIKMIDKNNGAEMWVAETRVQEYISKGHRLADIPKPIVTTTTPAFKVVKASARKRGK